MSASAVKWARLQKLPQTEKSILLELARVHSPREGYSVMSQEKIGFNVGVTRKTVNYAIARLVEKGLIMKGTMPRKKGFWDRCFYTLAPLEGGIKAKKRAPHRVTLGDTVPCNLNAPRYRVTLGDTSKVKSDSSVVDFTTYKNAKTSGGEL